MEQIPLTHEASAGDTNKQVTSCLPPELVQCLENARFLHLATCHDNTPHVSLMNYTYLPSSPHSPSPLIIMTTNPASKKANNLVANPRVSLLVHDWVSHRPLTSSASAAARPDPASTHYTHHTHTTNTNAQQPPSSLAALLLNLNSTAVSSISATIGGTARLADQGGPEERFYRARHLENNTFDEAGAASAARRESTVGEGMFVEGEDVRVIVVKIEDVRISDWKGTVRDWVIEPSAGQPSSTQQAPLVNGVA